MDFLSTVCPTSGAKAFVAAKGGYMTHYWAESHDTAKQAQLEGSGTSVYFALAGYDGTNFRRAANAVAARSFWLDLDAGEEKYAKHGDKVYETQTDALCALNLFCALTEMDPTYVVSSGMGLHVYWAMDEDIPAVEWRQHAAWFKEVVNHYGLRQDPARTADIASILRPVGSVHPSGEPVEIVYGTRKQTKLRDFVAFLEATGVPKPVVKTHTGEKPVFPDTTFETILTKSLQGAGCAQIAAIHACGGNVEEPLWRAGLSVVQACADSDDVKTAHLTSMSNGYGQFSIVETKDKAASTIGPYSCEAFASLNPAGCAGCSFRGGPVTNPIHLAGPIVTRLERLAALATAPAEAPQAQLAPMPQMDVMPGSFPQPQLPPPQSPVPKNRQEHFQDPRNAVMFATEDVEFRIGKWRIDESGKPAYRKDVAYPTIGVTKIRKVSEKDKDTDEWMSHLEATILLNVSLYLYDRVDDRGERSNNERYYVRVEYPLDPLRDFTLQAATIAKGSDTMRVELAKVGAMPAKLAYTSQIQEYLMGWTDYLREQSKARVAPMNMGWTPDNTIVYGDSEYTSLGPVPAPISDATAKFYAGSAPKGTKEGWRDAIAKMYPNGQLGVEAYQFMVLTGLAAPLYSRAVPDHEVGGVISFYSPQSGGGKTTAQRMALSVYGDPSAFHVAPNSTMLAKIQIMGMANSFPTYIDEITTSNARALTDFVYNATQGKGKDRMTEGGAALMDNHTSWRSFTLTSANLSLVETLQGSWGASDGTPMRVLEIEAPRVKRTGQDGDALQRAVQANRGSVGVEWLKTLVSNPADMEARVHEMKLRIQRDIQLDPAARFRLNMMAAVLAAGELAYSLDMHMFDMDKLYAWAITQLTHAAAQAEASVTTPETQFADFMQEKQRHILWVKGETVPDFDIPNVDVVGRAEPDKQLLWVSTKTLQSWCVEQNCSYGKITDMLLRSGTVRERKRLMTGSSRACAVNAVSAWRIDMSKLDIGIETPPEGAGKNEH